MDYDSLRRVDGKIFIGLVWSPALLCGECVSGILSQVVPCRTLVIWVGARQLGIRAYVIGLGKDDLRFSGGS